VLVTGSEVKCTSSVLIFMGILVIEDEVQLTHKVVSRLEQAGHGLRMTNHEETVLQLLDCTACHLLVAKVVLPSIGRNRYPLRAAMVENMRRSETAKRVLSR
jgi:DNA-binding NtrC family response regulator